MTLRLILMRHAKSDWGDPLLGDHDRPLNARGQASASAMGNWLREHGLFPELTLCSDAKRTQETCARAAMGGQVTFLRNLYLAGPDLMLRVLQDAGDAKTVLMIGHNPGIAEFAALLLQHPPNHPGFHDYPTCATLIASFDAENWAGIAFGQGNAEDFAIPREVMAG